MAHRGVFQYMPRPVVEQLFRGLRCNVLVTREGSPNGHILRDNETTMYDFKQLLPGREYVEVKGPAAHVIVFAAFTGS